MKTLYRPVGEKEMILIAESGYTCFPPRLNWQPIFYPVLNERYAVEIASQWNTNDGAANWLGFVLKFNIEDSGFLNYEIQNVGAEHNDELWVPADELNKFNEAIVGKIEVVSFYVGANFMSTSNNVISQIIGL